MSILEFTDKSRKRSLTVAARTDPCSMRNGKMIQSVTQAQGITKNILISEDHRRSSTREDRMGYARIVALDLGKFMTVACVMLTADHSQVLYSNRPWQANEPDDLD